VPAPPPPSSDRGRGLIIMSALADRLELRRAGRGTEVRLQFAR
jgi:anti-sigma regulatory factor (Ser/Thr protein kinase)